MSRIEVSHLTLIIIIINIVNILFTNTASIHGISLIPLKNWTTFLLLILIFLSIPILVYSDNSSQSVILNFGLILAILTSLLNIFGLNFSVFFYGVLLLFISIATLIPLVKRDDQLIRLYILLFTLQVLNLFTLVFRDVFIGVHLVFFSTLFEIGLFVSIIYFAYTRNYNKFQFGIIASVLLIGMTLGKFITTKSVPLLIIRTVIEQVLGINEQTLDLGFFSIGKNTLFIIHLTEIFVLAVLIMLRKHSVLFYGVILAGFDLTYPPLSGLRIILIALIINMKDKRMYKLSDHPLLRLINKSDAN